MNFDIRIVTVAALCVALMAPAVAKSQAKAGADDKTVTAPVVQDDDAVGAVRALYSPYLPGGDERMSAFDNEGERAKRFSAGLVKEMRAYFTRQEKAGDPGGLDFDPIVNGQDYKVDRLDVRADKVVAGKTAVVLAEFKNFDETIRLKYKLTFEGDVWKVDNILSLRDPVWDLRDLLKGE
jgi:hypothetical protein